MIERDFHHAKRSEAVGFSHSDFGFALRAPRGAVVLAGGSPAREAVTRRIRYRVLGCRAVTAQLSVDRETVGRKPSG